MGSIFGKLFEKISGETRQPRILMLGLDGAGKTTMVTKMKLGEVYHTVPTIGFQVEVLEFKGIKFNIWDIGGQDKIRALWKHYFPGTDALIYLVDSSDSKRIDLARIELMKLLENDDLKDCPLLVFANKMDLGINDIHFVKDKLDLDKIRGREWFLKGCSSLTGDGLYEGFAWMVKQMKSKKY